MSDSNSAKPNDWLWRLLTAPIPLWICILLFALLIVGLAVIRLQDQAAVERQWTAPNRPHIEILESDRELGTIVPIKILVQMKELSERDSPYRASVLNSLANAYVMHGKHDLAMPLYDEAREMLTRYLGPEHPDVALVDQNIMLARKLAQRHKSE